MAQDKPPPGPPNARRRRPPPVIDLEAREVQAEPDPAGAPPPGDAAASPDLPPQAAAPLTQESQPQPEAAFAPPPPPPPDPEPVREAGPEPRRAPFAFVPEELSWTHASAAVAGVCGGLLVAILFWLSGAFSGGRDATPDLNPRLAAIEKQLQELAARPAPVAAPAPAADPQLSKALDDIAARLGKLETAAATPRAPVTDPVVLGRLTASENALKSLSDNVAALSRRAEATDAAIRESQANINAGIARLTAAIGEVRSTAREAAAGSDRASRLAVAASSLRHAVERGEPFAPELAIVKPLVTDASVIAALEPFAASGVPSHAALGQELAAMVRPMLRASDAAPAPASGGFLDKLQANAEKLVRVRPVGEEPRGDDRTAVLSRIEQRATQGNVSGALAELNKLPADARAPFAAWIARAQARDKAIEAGRRLAADAVAALKASP